jgi:hypothetical protein
VPVCNRMRYPEISNVSQTLRQTKVLRSHILSSRLLLEVSPSANTSKETIGGIFPRSLIGESCTVG